jgi:hypothetical protein
MHRTQVAGEECSVITCVVGAVVNNRPLAKLPACDQNEPEALTPNHFLLGERYVDVAMLPAGRDYPYDRGWFHIQSIMDSSWRRFVSEIVPVQHVFNKWVTSSGAFHLGDIVLMLDKNERGLWKLATIEAVLPTERDEQGRRVRVRAGSTVYERSTHGLIQLLAIVD